MDATRARLAVDGACSADSSPDDFGMPHAAFTVCTFWLVEALAILERTDEARELFDYLLSLHNGLGLYSEDILPDARAERELPADVQPRRADQRGLQAVARWD